MQGSNFPEILWVDATAHHSSRLSGPDGPSRLRSHVALSCSFSPTLHQSRDGWTQSRFRRGVDPRTLAASPAPGLVRAKRIKGWTTYKRDEKAIAAAKKAIRESV